jgi:CO/xanthine dehydrogenase Mo-binding subunit
MTSSLIGASQKRPDALNKVTGAATYPGDLVKPGMLHLKVVFANKAHARILNIDVSAAMVLPGVIDVITAADVPFNAYGLIENDQPVLCRDKVRYVGDKIAIVVAESKAIANKAAKLVRVEYQELPVVGDVDTAMREDAPLVHDSHKSNVLFHMPIRKGDVAKGFAEADVVIEGEYQSSWQEHAYLQPEAGISYIDEQGRIVVETAGQWLHEDRRQIAAMLRLPEDQVVVRYASIGGAFGGREDLSMQHLLALAAWKHKKPVAMVWNREESMISHNKRHPFRYRCKWGARKDGTITAIQTEVVGDGGAYASTSEEVTKIATLFSNGAYRVENLHVDGYVVYTNNVPCGAFRGFGAPQAHWCAENMINRLAKALEIDPVELRRINGYREGDIEASQQPIPPGVSFIECLDRCVEELTAQGLQLGPQAVDPAKPHLRRGVGIAAGIKNVGYSFGYPEQSTATVEIHGNGDIEYAVVRAGVAEVGQGTHTALRQIAAETLGISFEQVRMVTDDSSETPNAGSVSASRMTLMGGRAIHEASKAALERWNDEERPAIATVQYRPPATTPLDPQTGAGQPNYCYGYVAQAAEVEVNTLTGQVQVLSLISVHDVGKAINRQLVEAQIEGCLAQALGYSLLEHFQVRDGLILTPHFSNYLLPTTLDMPAKVTPVILELADPNGPFGARGMAEMALVPLAPAIAMAIHEATGAWLTEQPMTPERVLKAIEQL